MLGIIRNLLKQIVDNIDSGNSNITQEEGEQIISTLKSITEPKLSKYQACKLLNIKRARFDQLVSEGKLPKGEKQQGFKELFWRKSDVLKYITTRK